MRRRLSSGLFVVLLCSLLAACGSFSGKGTIPQGTPDRGNGTPAIASAPTSTLGSFYAFVRSNQLMVALNGQAPQQMTDFDYTQLPNIFWQPPAWSPSGHGYVAFVMHALGSGIGGGGCPAQDYSAGGLYILNTQSRQVVQVLLPGGAQAVSTHMQPRMDTWSHIFWEDATHVLAWYNAYDANPGSASGLYRYDVVANKLSAVIPLNTITDDLHAHSAKTQPFLLSMRYQQGQFYYEVVDSANVQQSQLTIYRRSLSQPKSVAQQLLQVGSEAWCDLQHTPGPYSVPGWDISPDGGQLVAQMMDGSIQAVRLRDQYTTALFAHVPASVRAHDMQLRWAPDNQTVVLSDNNVQTQRQPAGPYSASLAYPDTVQTYAPNLAGPVSWRAGSAVFALDNVSVDGTSDSGVQSVYAFLPGEAHGQELLPNAYRFSWG